MPEFFLTLFSNSCLTKFPNNSASKFTVTLPKPLELTNGNWHVGLFDLFHPRILGSVKSGQNNGDSIKLPFIPSEKALQYNLDKFADFIIKHSERPDLYASADYFDEFLNINNLQSFNVNLAKYSTEIINTALTFRLTPFELPRLFRASMGDKNYIEIEAGREHSLKQLLWRIMNTYYEIFTKGDDQHKGVVKEPDKTVAETLLTYGMAFINAIREKSLAISSHESQMLLIYTDIVSESIVGDLLAKLLFITKRAKGNNEPVVVQNVRYIALSKSFIEDISFIFCDELGAQIMFEDGFSPTVVHLHFKSY